MACHKESHTNKLILGAILGGVVVGTSAIFLSSKQGKKFKDNASDKLEDLKDQLQDFLGSLNDKSQSIASDLSDRAEGYADRVQDFASQIREQIDALGEGDNKDRLTALLIGAIIGGMLGAGASAWLNSDSREKSDMFKNLGSSASAVKSTIKDILNVLEEKTGSLHHKASKSNTVSDIMDFATTGMQLWQKFQK